MTCPGDVRARVLFARDAGYAFLLFKLQYLANGQAFALQMVLLHDLLGADAVTFRQFG